MLKYYRVSYADGTTQEITREKALKIVLGTFKDTDITRDMLTIPNRIKCCYSEIVVKEEDGSRTKVLMAGLFNMTPADYEYDDDGNRIKG